MVSSLTGKIEISSKSHEVQPNLPAEVEAVVKLARAGVGEAVILAKIRTDAVPCKLTDDQIIYLGNQGVTENEIIALLEGK